MAENKKLLKNILISGKIYCETGLHIGGNKEIFDIGDIDNPVIKIFLLDENEKNTKVKEIPYIPGSSLKGRIRSLLEIKYGEYNINEKTGEGEPSTEGIIAKVFGKPAEKSQGKNELEVTRVIFRDAYPTKDTLKMWENIELETEIKIENTIDRIAGKSRNLRKTERVLPGSEFEFEIILSVFENDNESEMLKLLLEGMRLLEDTYLGGSGTRGYGKIKFKDISIVERPSEFYTNSEEENIIIEKGESLDKVINTITKN